MRLKKLLLLIAAISIILNAQGQNFYKQNIGRAKGGGGALFILFSNSGEMGIVKFDSTKIIYNKVITTFQKKIEDEDLILKYENIKSIKRLNTLLIFPNKLVIKMNNGTFHYFSTYKRRKIIDIVRTNIK